MNDEDILKGLEKIDWSAFDHAFGPATDIPGCLSDLLSQDESIRENAVTELSNSIWHQGTVYEASAHVVPFLLRMLRSSDVPDRRNPLFLLALLADGSSYLEVHASDDSISKKQLQEWLSGRGLNFDEELAREKSWVEATRKAVGEGLEQIIPFLTHSEAGIREVVAIALGNYGEKASELIPILEQAQECEGEEYVREEMERVLVRLRGE